MKKRLFIFISALFAAAVLLCACGNGEGENTSDTTAAPDTTAEATTSRETEKETAEDTGPMSLADDEDEDSADFGDLFS